MPYEHPVIVDIFAEIAARAATAIGSGINYQYGYLKELNQILALMSMDANFAGAKYPLIWLAQPFVEQRSKTPGYYSDIDDLRVFFLTGSVADMSAAHRMQMHFKEILYPMYHGFMKELANYELLDCVGVVPTHRYVDRYWWGDTDKAKTIDIVDCIEVSGLKFKVSDTPIC